MSACQSYRERQSICADGFIQRAKCRRWEPCQCGEYSMRFAPHCLSDELPDRWVTESGAPVFFAKLGDQS